MREEREENQMNVKTKLLSAWRKVKKGAVYVTVMSLAIATPVYATEGVTAPLNNLKTMIVSIIGAIGVIILAKNVMEFAQSYQQQDSSSMHSAIKGIVAGLIMASISSVIAFLGL